MKKIYIILFNTIVLIAPLTCMDLNKSMIGDSTERTQHPRPFDLVFSKQAEQNYRKQKNAIAKKQKANLKITIDEWKEYESALKDYNNNILKNDPLKADIQKKLEKLTKYNQQRERKAELAAFVAQSKEGRTIQDLQKYKENLKAYLAHLPNPTLETIKEYQDIINHIDLINEIDNQMEVDYTNFTINELYKYFELLSDLRKQLHSFESERYKKLDAKIAEVLSYYNEKMKDKREQQLLEQKRLAQLEDKLQKEELDQTLDTLINQAEKNIDEKALAQRKEMHQKQQKLEQQRLEKEKQRQIDELIKAAEEKQQREALDKERARQEQEKLAKLKRAQLEREHLAEQQRIILERQEQKEQQEENAKRWIPWITNRLNQTRQIVANFVENITSTITSWWWWLTRR